MVLAALTVRVVFLVLTGFRGKWRSDVHFGVHDYIYVYTGGVGVAGAVHSVGVVCAVADAASVARTRARL